VKLEYDYLGFSRPGASRQPYGPGNPFNSTSPTTTFSQHVHQFKLGLNYRLADGVNWPGSAGAMPFRAAPINSPSGWTFEAWCALCLWLGPVSKEIMAPGLPMEARTPTASVNSRLTYYDMQTNTSEVFGRINGPWNVFVKGICRRGHDRPRTSERRGQL
jgi:hypothetical protein